MLDSGSREIMVAALRVMAIDMKRSRQIETCLGGRVKKLVVNCMWEGKKNEERRVFGHLCGWWYS